MKRWRVLRRAEATGLKIRAGVAGVLQEVPVQVGQRIGPGTNLARVVDPTRLKAQLQVAETQVKDVAIGQKAEVDTRNGLTHTRGRVVRIDPAARNGTVTVDVALDEALPRGARPDMSVDGNIELERLDNVLFVGRPAFGQEQSKMSLFKLSADRATAALTPVELGRSSVNTIEVVRGPRRRRLRGADRHVAVGRLRSSESVRNSALRHAVESVAVRERQRR